MAEFGATYHMARTVKQLSASEDITATSDPKPGKALNNATANAVSDFYNSDSISRLMPGKRDYVSMRVDGIKENIQKRLIERQLERGLHTVQNRTPTTAIRFLQVRSTSSQKRCTARCQWHAQPLHAYQNAKLKLHGAKLERASAYRNILGDDYKGEINYKHLLAALACNRAMPECSLGKCVHCPSVDQLKGKLTAAFDELSVDEISYIAWVSVDRTSLETVVR